MRVKELRGKLTQILVQEAGVDPLTHVLSGIVAGAAVSSHRWAMVVGMASAVLPDAEFVTRRIPRTSFLDYHHGLGHTVLGGALLAWLGGIVGRWLTGLSFATSLAAAAAGVASHVLLDLAMHNNGIALFAPLSRRRFSFPLVLGLNPVTASPRCASQEYGVCLRCQASWMVRNRWFWVLVATAPPCLLLPRWAPLWTAATGLILSTFALRSNSRRVKALHMVPRTPHASRRKAFPAAADLSQWLVVERTPEAILATLADVAHGQVRWRREISLSDPPEPVRATSSLLSVRGFLNSVMFPWWTCEEDEEGWSITWRDASYLFSEQVDLYTLRIRVSRDGTILQNEFHERW